MIEDMVRGDIFKTLCRHIAFAVNTEGHNDSGFAGAVSSRYWSELANTGPKRVGEAMSREAGGKTYHALVCHSPNRGGWSETPEAVTHCLDALDIPDNETIAVVLMGAGPIGQLGGADTFLILGGLARSKRRVVVYTR